MTIKADQPVYVHFDGEIFAGFGSDVRQLNVAMHPHALRVIL
jgi:hypothetical protein